MTLFAWAVSNSWSKEEQLSYADKIYANNEFALAILQVLAIVTVCSATATEVSWNLCMEDALPNSVA